MSATCPALEHPTESEWGFCPSTPAAILFAILFGLTTLAHVYQAIIYKKVYCSVIVASGCLQTINFIFRIISIKNPDSLAPYAVWFVIILVAPLFTNAFIYMVMGRMVWNYIPDAKLYRIAAWRFSIYFVFFDVIALIIQVAGAASVAGSNGPDQRVLNGIHIYMGGVGFQQFFILVFSFFAIIFHKAIRQQVRQGIEGASSALPLLYAMYAVLILITVRIIFRLVEYAQGFKTAIPDHEAYEYCLDSVPMLCCLLILNFIHPGRIMPGKESDLPSRKEKRKGLHNKSEKTSRSPGLTV